MQSVVKILLVFLLVVVFEHNPNDVANREFKFKNIASPSKDDAAARAKLTLIDGDLDGGSAELAALTDVHIMVFFGPETPALYRPLAAPGRCHVLYSHYGCSPCVSAFNQRKTDCTDNLCLKTIDVREGQRVPAVEPRFRARQIGLHVQKPGPWNVGLLIRTSPEGVVAEVVATVPDHPFGIVEVRRQLLGAY